MAHFNETEEAPERIVKIIGAAIALCLYVFVVILMVVAFI